MVQNASSQLRLRFRFNINWKYILSIVGKESNADTLCWRPDQLGRPWEWFFTGLAKVGQSVQPSEVKAERGQASAAWSFSVTPNSCLNAQVNRADHARLQRTTSRQAGRQAGRTERTTLAASDTACWTTREVSSQDQ